MPLGCHWFNSQSLLWPLVLVPSHPGPATFSPCWTYSLVLTWFPWNCRVNGVCCLDPTPSQITTLCVWSRPPVEGRFPLTGYQPQGKSTPPNACNVIPPFHTPHQPLPGKMLADGCPLGNVDGTATANFIGTILWLPSGIPPGTSLCDT